MPDDPIVCVKHRCAEILASEERCRSLNMSRPWRPNIMVYWCPPAEAFGHANGLKLTWDLGYRQVEVETDSSEAFAAISGNSCLMGSSNYCADWTAHSSPFHSLGINVYDQPPSGIFSWLLADILGLGHLKDAMT
ncbi:conserved hypothetical protein [Ricinus communis]|uniref:RNase H type-1 domain-containing protein n=1 Tax=Ricinus communis TaxID=3988 RepID=B9RWH9_RICCO|nr:conserved hypothetical protein [Ricinus communis]